MTRLNHRAFKILSKEIQNCAGKDKLSKIEQEIVIKELEKLQFQQGSPATLEELKKLVISTYPQFSEKSLYLAAQANLPMSLWNKIKLAILLLVGSFVGLLVLVIIFPVPQRLENNAAKPIQHKENKENKEANLQNPARLSIDENYRQAIALVEQADRLVNQATGPADINLAEEKLNQAKKHIDRLPVSSYSSKPYFTSKGNLRYHREKVYEDQFASIRSKVEQMQAQLFQEKQAQNSLNQAEQALNLAKDKYEQAPTSVEREATLSSWQRGLDQLKQIPSETLAGKTALAKLKVYERDFVQFSGIEAAKQFGLEAAKLAQNPPHPAIKWRQIENQWQEAINRLYEVTEQDTGYIEAQKLLATYKTNLGTVQLRREAEEASVRALEQAKTQIESLLAESSTNSNLVDRNRISSEIQSIINQLKNVKTGTTAEKEAQELVKSAQKKLNELQESSSRTNFAN